MKYKKINHKSNIRKSFKRLITLVLIFTLIFSMIPALSAEAAKKKKRRKVKLARPVITSSISYEDGAIEISWTSVPNSNYYRIYRKPAAGGKYQQIAITKTRTTYTDRSAAANNLYYYRVQAVKRATKKNLKSFSKVSRPVKKRCRKYPERIAYLGDSVMSGFAVYGILNPNEASFARVSLFVHGLNYEVLPSVFAYNPDRAYIMIGTNDCVGSKTYEIIDSVANEYVEIVTKLRSNNPNIEICIFGTSNTRSSTVPNGNVNLLNSLVRSKTEHLKYVKYLDTGAYLNDGTGQLSYAYSGGDGIHWNVPAYQLMHEKVAELMRTW